MVALNTWSWVGITARTKFVTSVEDEVTVNIVSQRYTVSPPQRDNKGGTYRKQEFREITTPISTD